MNPLDNLTPELERGLIALNLPVALAPRLLDYLTLLHKWNSAFNLTAIRDPREMLVKHLFDSLAMHPFVDAQRLADLGTGPGLPGIPLAIAKPSLHVALVESNGKKARFLRQAVRELGLDNARVLESRAEQVAEPGAFDAITARALDRLAGIIAVGGHLLQPDGRLLAMKAARIDEEAAELPAGWQVQAVHPLRVPGLDAARHLVVVARTP
jgi:16S rRNA (guanine527-N7)-methyltransferase